MPRRHPVIMFLPGLVSIYFLHQNTASERRLLHGQNTTAAGTWKESPRLDRMVKTGKLPPVEQRLPSNPLIIRPADRVGQYGGTWHMVMLGPSDRGFAMRTIGYEGLVRWDQRWTRVLPNLAERWEISPDLRKYTFFLRRGLRWSDGQPFTSEDIVFANEAVLANREVNPVPENWALSGNRTWTVRRLDRYSFEIALAEPNSLLLENLAHPRAAIIAGLPKHCLERYHPSYSSDAARLAMQRGSNDWRAVFWQHAQVFAGTRYDPRYDLDLADCPTMNAWVFRQRPEPHTAMEDRVIVADRNPFYWKVDPSGNQLPYLDRVEFSVTRDVGSVLRSVLAGKADFQYRYFATPANYPTVERGQTAAGYALFKTLPAKSNSAVLSVNLTHRDSELRALFRQKQFREALSIAINRDEIIRSLYGRTGVPYQAAPRPESPLYHKRLARQYTDYDPARASRLLDELRLIRDNHGLRRLPSGRTIRITIDHERTSPADLTVLPFVQKYWRALGLEIELKSVSASERFERLRNNLHDAMLGDGDGGLDVLIEPRYYLPVDIESHYAVRWAHWFGDPNSPLAELPPVAVQEQMRLYREILATRDAVMQKAKMQKILDIAAEQFYVIGILLPGNGYGVVRRDFRNVPKLIYDAWTYPSPAPTNPCQYFIERSSAAAANSSNR